MSEGQDPAPVIPGIRPHDRVLVLGGYGTGNVGDEAILDGLLTRLDRSRTTVVSRNPAQTRRLHGVAAISPAQALLRLTESDALLVGGGGLFSRDMGAAGRLIPLFGLAAVALGRRVVLEGVSIDFDLPALTERTLPPLARRSTSVRVRDAMSLQVLRSWGVSAQHGRDLSEFMTPSPPSLAAITELGFDLERPRVGLCLNAVRPADEEQILDVVPRLVRRLPQYQFCFLPMSRHPRVPRQDDLRLGMLLKARTPELLVILPELHPRETAGLFDWFSVAVCMRFHSFLFAHRARVPVVAWSYAEKTERWLVENGYSRSAMDAVTGEEELREIIDSQQALKV